MKIKTELEEKKQIIDDQQKIIDDLQEKLKTCGDLIMAQHKKIDELRQELKKKKWYHSIFKKK